MRILVAMAFAGTALGLGMSGRAVMAAPHPEDLVLIGTVFSIRQGGPARKPWIVTVDVEKVVSGDFPAARFAFAVQSPSRSGLQEGHSYEIRAVWWEGDGYEVDENQWRKPDVSVGRQTLDSLPHKLNVVVPKYPAEAKAHQIQGDVTLAMTVSADGRTSEVAVVKSGGTDFDRAAIEAARAMTWEPARKNGVAVPYRLHFTLRFRLDE